MWTYNHKAKERNDEEQRAMIRDKMIFISIWDKIKLRSIPWRNIAQKIPWIEERSFVGPLFIPICLFVCTEASRGSLFPVLNVSFCRGDVAGMSWGCRGDVARDLQLIRVLRALQIANLSVTGTKNIKILNVVICHPKESKSLKAIFFN